MRSPLVCYLGWHGQGNIGDDAIRDAVGSALYGAQFVDLPLEPRLIATSMAQGLPHRLKDSTLVLGGGTCIGRRNWRRLVRFGTALAKAQPGFAIGVGVEDPAFRGHRSYSDRGELGRWRNILGKFQSVSVRGPRSAELLSGVGVEASVVGDPALLLPRPQVEVSPARIGVNFGFGDDLWGHDPAFVAGEMAAACRELDALNYELVGILMSGQDRKWLEWALSGVSGQQTFVIATDSSQVISELARCSVVIVSRLHAAILASISGTPTVALEYQPKCRDFALSVDNAASLIRTDTVTAGEIVEHVNAALNERELRSQRTLEAVDRLRDRLISAYGAARGSLGLPELLS